MTTRKARLTITVDRSLVQAASAAVAAGRADSLSAWVNLALADRAAKDLRLAALAELVGEYEAAHGEITAAELVARERADRREAIVVRGPKRSIRKPRRSRAA